MAHDTANLARECDNVLLLRTMSKGYSLAGLRLGYGIGSPGLVLPMLTKTKDFVQRGRNRPAGRRGRGVGLDGMDHSSASVACSRSRLSPVSITPPSSTSA
ncbi:aminotransferase class I/II-fold pyridoxal phosphate-dependent enzyme [Microvirga sp. VF16]|uniref:aminotransferase class I/II-fold pyridoxal phosphate-dependent enzyme n=1 Tax=Microvirga sp. VF16 TaxID=2807101 RepID=UPI00193D6C48|nr:aminotransferase class I/II-fold pyridoxal phosphate-dependent enzyme [Microvirga sp. VF16]